MDKALQSSASMINNFFYYFIMEFVFGGKVKREVKSKRWWKWTERGEPWNRTLFEFIHGSYVMFPLQQLCSVVVFYDYWENIMIKLWLCVADPSSSLLTQLDEDLCGPISSITHTLMLCFFLVQLPREGSSVLDKSINSKNYCTSK